MVSKSAFILFLACGVANVQLLPKKKIPCALDDYACTSITAGLLFKSIMKGRPEFEVPSSEPLHKDVVHGLFKDLNYTLTDANLYGMSNCRVKRYNINILQFSWNLLLHCPQMIMKSNYEVFGTIGEHFIEGKGLANIVVDKYRIGLRGDFSAAFNLMGRLHLRLTTFQFERLESVGTVKTELTNLYNGDTAKSEFIHEFIQNNWKTIGNYLQYPAMRAFMTKVFDNINIYLRAVPADELFYREE